MQNINRCVLKRQTNNNNKCLTEVYIIEIMLLFCCLLTIFEDYLDHGNYLLPL